MKFDEFIKCEKQRRQPEGDQRNENKNIRIEWPKLDEEVARGSRGRVKEVEMIEKSNTNEL